MWSFMSPFILSHTFTNTNLKLKKCYSPVGNCEEANRVSRIPAPSINANRIPPMAADPTMATGPSMDEQGLSRISGGS